MDENKIKPVNPDKGWQLKMRYVDETGQVFSRGQFQGMESDLPPVETSEEKPSIADYKSDAAESQKSVDDVLAGLPPELIIKLQEKFTKENHDMVQKQLDDFKKSLAPQQQTSSGFNVDDLAEAMVRAQQFQSKGAYYRNVKDLDPNDYDPIGCVFTSYGTGYVIVDDKRNGQAVRTPYGRFFTFKHSVGRVTKIGPHAETYSALCTFGTNSKKEIEWLKNHSKFNIEFFLDAKDAISGGSIAAQETAKVNNEIRRLTQTEILRRAESMGIALGGDLEGIVRQLIMKIADERINKVNKALTERMKETSMDSEFVGAK